MTDEILMRASRNAVRVCLQASPGESATLVADEEASKGMVAITEAMIELGVGCTSFMLEEMGTRPLAAVSSAVLDSLANSQISVLWCRPMPGELPSRLQIINEVKHRSIRHAHIVQCSPEEFASGLMVDYRKIRTLQQRIHGIAVRSKSIRITSAGGSDLVTPLPPDGEWVLQGGIIEPGKFQNLPSGQMFCAPLSVNGVFVADAAMGEWFGPRYPEISKYPLTIHIADGRCVDLYSENHRLAREFLLYIKSSPNGNRLSELSLGTNLGLSGYTGNPILDEHRPGAHIALGDSFIKTHIPLICRDATVTFDDIEVLREGVFSNELLHGLAD